MAGHRFDPLAERDGGLTECLDCGTIVDLGVTEYASALIQQVLLVGLGHADGAGVTHGSEIAEGARMTGNPHA